MKSLLLLVPLSLAACGSSQDEESALSESQLTALHQACLDQVNAYRTPSGLEPLLPWSQGEACSDEQAQADLRDESPHGHFSSCGEKAQNTCPGWPADSTLDSQLQSLRSCLQVMWAEGPGEPYSAHGHYLNMSSQEYTLLACGVHLSDGRLWVNLNFR